MTMVKIGSNRIPGLSGAGIVILLLWILLAFLALAFRAPFLFSFGQILLFLSIALLTLAIEDRILRGRSKDQPDRVLRRNRLLFRSSAFFILGFFLFVNGLLQLLMTGQRVMYYGWDVVDGGTYLIIVLGLAFGSMLLIAGAVAIKRFIDLSDYF